jgi:Icc-related predicted phosphoesterase
MDLPQHDALFDRLGVSLNGRGVRIDDVGFFGASSAPFSQLHTPYEVSEEEILRRCREGYAEVRDCPVKVFVPHAPPYGTRIDIIHSGLHVGSTAVREFIEDTHPALTVCGHIHEARGRDHLDGMEIVNCGPAARGYYVNIEIGKIVRTELSVLKRDY